MTSESTSRLVGLVEGAPVVTRDGEELGTVKEISGASFKVNAPMAADYWLSCEHVTSANEAGVRLEFPREQLDHYRLKEPGLVSESPILQEESDTFASDHDKEAKRREMEHPSGQG